MTRTTNDIDKLNKTINNAPTKQIATNLLLHKAMMNTSNAVPSVQSVSGVVRESSAPAPGAPRQVELRKQTSAPSYLRSLRDNPAPPFKVPAPLTRPRVVTGTVVTADDITEIISVGELGMDRAIGDLLVRKGVVKNFDISEKAYLVLLVLETIDYGAARGLSAGKLSCLLTVYLTSHLYFKAYYWLPPTAVWDYFKELLIRHTVQDTPDSEEIFLPDESYDILSHFHTIYMNNLPLIHILTFGVHRIKFVWPFKK